MASKKPELVSGEIYHLYNRGIEKKNIFGDDNDRYRFIFSLYECNDRNFVIMRDRINKRKERNSKDYGKMSIGLTYGHSRTAKKRDNLVEILAFALLPNHYHLIVRQTANNGIPLFMQKLGNSHTGYFNEKYDRRGSGSLFQGTYKAVYVRDNIQFMNLVVYVLANPLGVIEPDWKNAGVKNAKKAIKFLNNYRWSSYLDSIGVENFPSVTKRDFIYKVFGGAKNDIAAGQAQVKNQVEGWVNFRGKYNKSLSAISDLIVEKE